MVDDQHGQALSRGYSRRMNIVDAVDGFWALPLGRHGDPSSTWSAPAASSIWATRRAVIGSRGSDFLFRE